MVRNMDSLFSEYTHSVSKKFQHLETSEMGYRADFETLLKGIFGSVTNLHSRIDHDAKARQGNKPDFVVLNGEIPILYIEAKDIGISLDKVEKSEQMTRYYGYANLVLTDYLEFRFYRNGLKYGEAIKIAEHDIKTRTLKLIPENYNLVSKTLLDFAQSHREPIRSGAHLAKIMGGKAQRIRDNLNQFFETTSNQNNELFHVYEAIRKMLVHDLSLESFADMYAQTLVYGLFVARYYDDSAETFSRQEARDLVPTSNPFLQHFFDHIAGPTFDKRLSYIVDELCEVFKHADTKKLVEDYLSDADPIIHFYEDFLKEYDPELRKKMGAYYTPLPVVNFIVRSVDQILQKDFGLAQGLVDTEKLSDGRHRVQILDPAVGTGTFISATIRLIYERLLKQGQEGRWPTYVHNELLPRLHGFELMMAPYTIAHLKLSLAFKQTGFWKFHRRLGIYLTNSLEEGDRQESLLSFGLAESIAHEAKEASAIKNNTPIMVVVGNPPYSVSSSNKSTWILDLMGAYKTNLKEQNIQPLSDDYLKFIRFAEHFIEKNKSGVVAMITSNSFLDGIIHRQMRKHLLETFDDIYILDLHGNSKRKEKSLDGSKDENVFDIQQGVSINIFVRKAENKKMPLGKVYFSEIFGKRELKFEVLNKKIIEEVDWKELNYSEPYYFFVPKDFELNKEFEKNFQITELFNLNSVGIVTSRDSFLIDDKKEILEKRREDILDVNISNIDFENKYNLKTKYFNPDIARTKSQLIRDSKIIKCFYRPLDSRFVLFDNNFIERSRNVVMQHMFAGQNLALVCSKQSTRKFIDNIQVVNSVIELKLNSHDRNSNIFPLYLYPEDGSKTPNLNKEIWNKINAIVGETTPENILDYIYAVLHSPTYREKYKEFLKIDFPRVPYPNNKDEFNALIGLGKELREIHLLESAKVNQFITTYPVSGSDIVEKISYKDGSVFINSEQHFGNVPEVAWNFYIGGYQPAQKWLKDRKGRSLSNEDIEHYQKIIVALTETDRIMKEIDKVIKL